MPSVDEFLEVECLCCGDVRRIHGDLAVELLEYLDLIYMCLEAPKLRPPCRMLVASCGKDACATGQIDLDP